MLSNKVDELSKSLSDLESKVLKLNDNLQILCNLNIETISLEDLSSHQKEIDQFYTHAMDASITCLRAIDSMKSATKYKVTSKNNNLPTPSEATQMVNDFLHQNIEKSPPPLPMNGGCYSHRFKKTSPNQFICGSFQKSSHLMITSSYNEETQICYAFDPFTITTFEFDVIPLRKNEWTPLPTTIPEHPNSRYEHPKGCNVLSLWMNDSSNEWSNIFYPATVAKRPCDRYREDTENRGYELHFFDGSIQIVPERFVVPASDEW